MRSRLNNGLATIEIKTRPAEIRYHTRMIYAFRQCHPIALFTQNSRVLQSLRVMKRFTTQDGSVLLSSSGDDNKSFLSSTCIFLLNNNEFLVDIRRQRVS